MLVVTGRYENNDPLLKIFVGSSAENMRPFDALIDTGFTGFLSLPASLGNELGLKPDATAPYTYADGVVRTRPTALGFIKIENQSREGVIVLEEGSDGLLIGIDFLRRFRFGLFMTKAMIALFDEDEMNAFVDKARAPSGPRPTEGISMPLFTQVPSSTTEPEQPS